MAYFYLDKVTERRFNTEIRIEIKARTILDVPSIRAPSFRARRPSSTAMIITIMVTKIERGVDSLTCKIPDQTQGKKNRIASMRLTVPLN